MGIPMGGPGKAGVAQLRNTPERNALERELARALEDSPLEGVALVPPPLNDSSR